MLCAITIPPADLRSLSLYYYAICGRMGMSSAIQNKCLTFHILDIMNIVEIILRNCCITDDIHMRPHTA